MASEKTSISHRTILAVDDEMRYLADRDAGGLDVRAGDWCTAEPVGPSWTAVLGQFTSDPVVQLTTAVFYSDADLKAPPSATWCAARDHGWVVSGRLRRPTSSVVVAGSMRRAPRRRIAKHRHGLQHAAHDAARPRTSCVRREPHAGALYATNVTL